MSWKLLLNKSGTKPSNSTFVERRKVRIPVERERRYWHYVRLLAILGIFLIGMACLSYFILTHFGELISFTSWHIEY